MGEPWGGFTTCYGCGINIEGEEHVEDGNGDKYCVDCHLELVRDGEWIPNKEDEED